ncbi:MAG: electron transfer flavoprotein subunit alpha, partial [Desulfosarcina sp.]
MARNRKGIEVAEIISDQCIACQICIGECPVGAIELSADGVAHIDPEVCIGCGKCAQVCPVGAVDFEKRRHRPLDAPQRGARAATDRDHQGVGVFIETAGGAAVNVAWELTGKARELADRMGTQVIGFVLGDRVDPVAREAIAYGCDVVHVVDHPELGTYLSRPFGKILADLCKTVRPEILLMGATSLGRDLAGVVATRLGTGLTADCTELDVETETGLLLMTRPTFGGNIMATIFCEHRRPQMCTVRPKVMRLPPKDDRRDGAITGHDWQPPTDPLAMVLAFENTAGSGGGVDIAETPVLVVAGKGACDGAALPMLEELAGLLGGTLACSRPVVEAGLMPYDRQVGQTGK